MSIQYNTIWQLKKNETLICATKKINVENIMMFERSQSLKMTYCMILLI